MGVKAVGCKTCGNSPLKQAAQTVHSIPSKVVDLFHTVIQGALSKASEVTKLVTSHITRLHDHAWTSLTDVLAKYDIPYPNIALLKKRN